MSTVTRIKDYVEKRHYADDIYVSDSDCELVATHIADALKGTVDPKKIRRTIERACSDLENAGMIDDSSDIEQDVINIVLNPSETPARRT